MLTIDTDLPNEIISAFNDKLNHLKIDEKTFERAKKANIASLILDYEDVDVVNGIIQAEVLSYGDVITNLKEIYENITYHDLVEFLKVLNTKERSILVLKPLEP